MAGSSSLAEADKLLQPFRGFEVDGTATIFGADYPLHTYQFKNNGMHLLGIYRPTLFQAGLTFRDGIVIERSAGLFQEPDYSVGTRESLAGLLQNTSLDESASGMIAGVYDPPTRMDVFLDTRASKTTLKDAYDYNLSCFTSLKGCRNVYDMLPGMRQGIGR